MSSLAFKVPWCSHTFLWCTGKKLVAYATSWSLTLSPVNCGCTLPSANLIKFVKNDELLKCMYIACYKKAQKVDSLADTDKAKIEVLFLSNTFCIGDAFYHELTMIGDGLPKSNMVKQHRDQLNDICHISPKPRMLRVHRCHLLIS